VGEVLVLDSGVNLLILPVKISSELVSSLGLVELERQGLGGLLALLVALERHLELLLEALEIGYGLGWEGLEGAEAVGF